MTLTMEEGFIGEWYVKEGDFIKLDDQLCSVENEKETEDMMSMYEGTILKILAPEGAAYPVKTPIAVVGEPGEDYSALLITKTKAVDEEPQPRFVRPDPTPFVMGDQYRIMPKIRKIIQEKGIDIEELVAFCDGRRITEAEIAAFEKR